MTTDDKVEMRNYKYDINIEATKISTLSSCKLDNYLYFTGV